MCMQHIKLLRSSKSTSATSAATERNQVANKPMHLLAELSKQVKAVEEEATPAEPESAHMDRVQDLETAQQRAKENVDGYSRFINQVHLACTCSHIACDDTS